MHIFQRKKKHRSLHDYAQPDELLPVTAGMPTRRRRLYVVEGLPGTGKSTATKTLAAALMDRHRNVQFFDEGDPQHPADFERYDFPDFATEREMILAKWHDFANAPTKHATYVFNGVVLQNPVTEALMRFDVSEAECRDYVCEIADVIRPGNPLIIYLKTDDVRATLDHVSAERGDGWLQYVETYHTRNGYGLRNGLTGYDGYLACLEKRQETELKLLKYLGIDFVILPEKPSREQLVALLDLPPRQ